MRALEWTLSYIEFNVDAAEAAGPLGLPVPMVGGPPSGWMSAFRLLPRVKRTDDGQEWVSLTDMISAHGGDSMGILSAIHSDSQVDLTFKRTLIGSAWS